MGNYERAQVQEFGGYHGRFLSRDEHPSRKMPLLTNDGEEGVRQTCGSAGLGLGQVLQTRSQYDSLPHHEMMIYLVSLVENCVANESPFVYQYMRAHTYQLARNVNVGLDEKT